MSRRPILGTVARVDQSPRTGCHLASLRTRAAVLRTAVCWSLVVGPDFQCVHCGNPRIVEHSIGEFPQTGQISSRHRAGTRVARAAQSRPMAAFRSVPTGIRRSGSNRPDSRSFASVFLGGLPTHHGLPWSTMSVSVDRERRHAACTATRCGLRRDRWRCL